MLRAALLLALSLVTSSAFGASPPHDAPRTVSLREESDTFRQLDKRISDLQSRPKFVQLLPLRLSRSFVAGAPVEESIVASGVTIADFIVTDVGNNIEHSTALTNAFSTAGTTTVTVHHTSHGKSATNKFSIQDGPTIDGLNMNGTWVVASVPNANSYTFTHTGTASGTTATTGTAVVTFSDRADDGKLRFLCYMSHINYDDPLKFPGQEGAAHGHMFFGNTLTDYSSTYASLRAAGNGTCDGGPINRSAYWFPWLVTQAGTKVKYPVFMAWYYTNPARKFLADFSSPACPSGVLQDGGGPVRIVACPQRPIRRLQRGQKAIFGYDPSMNGGAGGFPAAVTSNMFNDSWSCQDAGIQQGGTYRYLHHRSNASLGLSSNGSCPASNGSVQFRASSPNCWTGALDSEDHYTHFANPAQDGQGNLHCPSTHPYVHATFEIIINWNYASFSDVATWFLSSDRHNGADFEAGTTFHWDMIFAWEDEVSDFWAENIWGASPDSNDPPTYIFKSAGEHYQGGKHMRNTNDGGLGVAGITPCTTLTGVVFASCHLKGHGSLGVGITDTEVNIPDPP